MRIAKTFTLTLVLIATLATPLAAASRQDAKHNGPRRDTSAIERIINRINELVRALSDQVVVPQPAPAPAPPVTTT